MDDYAGYKRLIVPDLADRGYFSGAKIAACDKAGITVVMPRPETSGNRSMGMYVKADFKYDAERDVYICPTENGLIYRYRRKEVGLSVGRYWTNEYQHCPVKSRCTRGTERRVTRWEYEHLVDEMRDRLRSAAARSRILSGRSRPGWEPPIS